MDSKPLVAASLKPFVLAILAEGESYGYEVIQKVRDLTDGEIEWTTGSLYPLLHRLENRGYLESTWRPADAGPRRKYYRLTARGRRALEAEKRQWLTVHHALESLWGPAPGLAPG